MSRCFLSASRLMVFAAGLAIAAAGAAQTQPDHEPPALGGPEVRDREVPGVRGEFGTGVDGKRRDMADRIPPRAMRGALAAIMDEDAPEDVRATDEQRQRIRAIMRDFESQVRDYIESNRARLQELRAQIPAGAISGPAAELFRHLDGARRGDDRRPARAERQQGDGKARRIAEEIPVEVREQLREIAAGLPSFEDAYTRIWAELRPEQQRVVGDRLEEFRERQARTREEMYVRKRLNSRDDAPDKRPPGAGPRPDGPGRNGADGRGAPPRPRASGGDRRERMLRAFERLTPEQQEQVLARLEARGVSRLPGLPRRGEARPAPSEGDMPVPPPRPPADENDPMDHPPR